MMEYTEINIPKPFSEGKIISLPKRGSCDPLIMLQREEAAEPAMDTKERKAKRCA